MDSIIILFTVPVTLIMDSFTIHNTNKYVADYLVKFMSEKRISHQKNNSDIIVNISALDEEAYKRLTGIFVTTLVILEPETEVSLTKKSKAFVKTHIIGHEKARRDKDCLWITPKDYAGLILAIHYKETRVIISPKIYLHRLSGDVKQLVKKAKTYVEQLETAIRSADAEAFDCIDTEIQRMVIPSFIIDEEPIVEQPVVEVVKPAICATHTTSWAAIAKGNTLVDGVSIETDHVRTQTPLFVPPTEDESARLFVPPTEDESARLFDQLIAVQTKFNEKQIEQTKLIRELSSLANAMIDLQIKLGIAPSVPLYEAN